MKITEIQHLLKKTMKFLTLPVGWNPLHVSYQHNPSKTNLEIIANEKEIARISHNFTSYSFRVQ